MIIKKKSHLLQFIYSEYNYNYIVLVVKWPRVSCGSNELHAVKLPINELSNWSRLVFTVQLEQRKLFHRFSTLRLFPCVILLDSPLLFP